MIFQTACVNVCDVLNGMLKCKMLCYKSHILCVSFPQTLVLAKVTPKQFKSLPSPYKDGGSLSVDPDPLCSNIYSVSERILLLWLNHHYEQQRTIVWQTSAKGPCRCSCSVCCTPVKVGDRLTQLTELMCSRNALH